MSQAFIASRLIGITSGADEAGFSATRFTSGEMRRIFQLVWLAKVKFVFPYLANRQERKVRQDFFDFLCGLCGSESLYDINLENQIPA